MPLTDTVIKALRPKDKPYRAYDSGGLYLEFPLQAQSFGVSNIVPRAKKKDCLLVPIPV